MNLTEINTIDLIQEIVKKNDQIAEVRIHSYPDAPQLQERVKFDKIEQFHYSNALKLRKEYNVPFWDSLMLSFYNQKEFSKPILENVLNNHKIRSMETLSRNEILGTSLKDLSSSDSNYAINSKIITTDNKIRHLLLLDFHIPESDDNQSVVESVLNILEIKRGFLLKSGKSYHFIGDHLLSTSSLTKFLGKCLFFTPIIDKSWIAHQLIERSCSVRFTKKNNLFPTLIKRI